MEGYFDKNLVKVGPVSKKTGKEFVIKHHYTHSLNLCKIAYGVFYRETNFNKFIDSNYKLIGVVAYSHPVGRSAANSFSGLVKPDGVLELVRLVILDGFGRNIESYVISQTFTLIKKEFPNIKIILSYADPSQTHVGLIYQATNFMFLGLNSDTNLMPNYSISLLGPPNYKWLHSRTVFATYGSHNIDHLKNKIGRTFWRKKESGKYKYIYILTNKMEKKKILNSLKPKILPYPKNFDYNEEIERFDVGITKENRFFT